MADPHSNSAPHEVIAGAPRRWNVAELDDKPWATAAPLPATPPTAPTGESTPNDSIAVNDEEPKAEPRATGGPMPTIVLVSAGLAVFDSILSLAYLALWQFNAESLLAVLQQFGLFSLLAAMASVLLGAKILNPHRGRYLSAPGGPWALAAIAAGVALALLTLGIPFFSALSLLFEV